MFDGSDCSESVMVSFQRGDEGTFTRAMMEHEVIDHRLQMYAKQRATLDAAEAFDLVRAQQGSFHRKFGYATFTEYLERRCGYLPHTARERMRVARALVSLPATATALSKGELTYSHVRELTRVAVPETEDAWIAASAGKTAGQLQKQVSYREVGDLPTDPEKPQLRPMTIRFELPPAVAALVREARKVLADERGGLVSDAELVEAMCRRILDPSSGADGPAHQIGYKQCSDCQRAQVTGAGRTFDVTSEQLERAACDAVILGDLDAEQPERARSSVTPRMRAQIFARDGYHCVVPGCRSSRNLEVHHLIPRSEGGPNELWNCCILCGGHHVARHEGLLAITGRAPHELRFKWTYGPPLPPGLDAEGRIAAMRSAIEAICGDPVDADERPTLDEPVFARPRRKGRRSRPRGDASTGSR